MFEWYKIFFERRLTAEENPRLGLTTTSITDDNIYKIDKQIRKNCRMNIQCFIEISRILK